MAARLVTEERRQVLEGLPDPVGRFVEHQGSRLPANRLKPLTPCLTLGGEKPFEGEALNRQTRRGERGDERTGTWDRYHPNTGRCKEVKGPGLARLGCFQKWKISLLKG